ncbi:MAG: SDR family NAD(P)-dependent oxidoreductase [Rhodothermales bacterium]|nr:SDR family NAD(P)-dependent oxidoreductase [Rhodothermales bacterium]HAY37650.1 3-oxoacyl-ACP reductase [Bacteroidota bacterium]
MHIKLNNKVVLVTGASRGIGREIAKQLGAAGAKVAVHYGRSSEEAVSLCKEIGRGAEAFRADLADAGEAHALFKNVVAEYGQIDILVNNAGIAVLSEVEGEYDEWLSDWNRTMDINTRASAILIRSAIPHFKQHGGGKIINIASRAAFRGDTEEYLAYAASKGAMVSLSRSVARAYGKENITSFVIAPGFVRTDMAQDAIDAYGEDYVVGGLALNKLTEPKDVAPMVVLLASGLADHATGTSIDINAASYVH